MSFESWKLKVQEIMYLEGVDSEYIGMVDSNPEPWRWHYDDGVTPDEAIQLAREEAMDYEMDINEE